MVWLGRIKEEPEEGAEQVPCISISVSEEPLEQAAKHWLFPPASPLSSLLCIRKWVENCDKPML